MTKLNEIDNIIQPLSKSPKITPLLDTVSNTSTSSVITNSTATITTNPILSVTSPLSPNIIPIGNIETPSVISNISTLIQNDVKRGRKVKNLSNKSERVVKKIKYVDETGRAIGIRAKQMEMNLKVYIQYSDTSNKDQSKLSYPTVTKGPYQMKLIGLNADEFRKLPTKTEKSPLSSLASIGTQDTATAYTSSSASMPYSLLNPYVMNYPNGTSIPQALSDKKEILNGNGITNTTSRILTYQNNIPEFNSNSLREYQPLNHSRTSGFTSVVNDKKLTMQSINLSFPSTSTDDTPQIKTPIPTKISEYNLSLDKSIIPDINVNNTTLPNNITNELFNQNNISFLNKLTNQSNQNTISFVTKQNNLTEDLLKNLQIKSVTNQSINTNNLLNISQSQVPVTNEIQDMDVDEELQPQTIIQNIIQPTAAPIYTNMLQYYALATQFANTDPNLLQNQIVSTFNPLNTNDFNNTNEKRKYTHEENEPFNKRTKGI